MRYTSPTERRTSDAAQATPPDGSRIPLPGAAHQTKRCQLNIRVTAEEKLLYDNRRSQGVSTEVAVSALLNERVSPAPAIVLMPRGEPVGGPPKPALEKIKSGLCEHRVPKGTFCKRCGT